MQTRRLYCPELTVGLVTLLDQEAYHAGTVLRVEVGAPVTLFDGRGRVAEAVVATADRQHLVARVDEIQEEPFDLSRHLTLAVAPPKLHRQAYLVEKCTELGVAAIRPIITARGTARPSTGAISKWQRRAIEAAKQSQRSWVPLIEEPCCFDDSLRRHDAFDAAAIAHNSRGDARVDGTSANGVSVGDFIAQVQTGRSLVVYVGPEGGWTGEELAAARDAGLVRVTLGPTVLRTETAAVAVAAAVALL